MLIVHAKTQASYLPREINKNVLSGLAKNIGSLKPEMVADPESDRLSKIFAKGISFS